MKVPGPTVSGIMKPMKVWVRQHAVIVASVLSLLGGVVSTAWAMSTRLAKLEARVEALNDIRMDIRLIRLDILEIRSYLNG